MRDNVEVEGQIKSHEEEEKKVQKACKRLDRNFWGDVAEFLYVRSFRRNIFAKVRSSKSMTLKELIGCNF